MEKIVVGMSLLAWIWICSPAWGYTSADYCNAGQQFYNSRNYEQAIQYFNAAIQMDPLNTAALLGRANSNYSLGRNLEALNDYEKVQAISPSDQLGQFIQALRAQTWTAAPAAPASSTPAVKAGAPRNVRANKRRCIRVSGGITPLDLTVFKTHVQGRQSEARLFQEIEPAIRYNGSFPDFAGHFEFEGDYIFGTNWEIGAYAGLIPAGEVKSSITDGAGYSLTDSFYIVALLAGFNARYLIGQGNIQPWIAAKPAFVAGNINYKFNLQNYGGYVTFGGTFPGLGVGGQAQAGLDVRVSDSVVITAFGGYQAGFFGNFEGTMGDVNVPGITEGSRVQLMVVPTSLGDFIIPVSNGRLCVSTIDHSPGDPVPQGSELLSVDLSGIVGGISVGVDF